MKNRITDNISVRGFSHVRANIECQDSSLCWQTDTYSAAIVCDGHGGEKYIRSAIGSRSACEAGKERIGEFMQKIYCHRREERGINPRTIEWWLLKEHNYDRMLCQLERSVIQDWTNRVLAHAEQHPLEEDERFAALSDADRHALTVTPVKAYGSTFIAAVVTDSFCFVLKLGDGNAVLIRNDGPLEMPEELADDALQFNVTTSLCNSDADMAFRHCFRSFEESAPVTGVVLSSDGIINCYTRPEAFSAFIQNVYAAYGEEDTDAARDELEAALHQLSEKGSGDDMSVAIVRVCESPAMIEVSDEMTDPDECSKPSVPEEKP